MSLLLRMIIPALRSESSDLVNLGLRTLEFWIDNLNPEFLYPILSKQSNIFVELMTSLSKHLQPAPYPYGLLTLRLLGKLGGKNRRFLREPFDQHSRYDNLRRQLDVLAIDCVWEDTMPWTTQKGKEREADEPVLKDETETESFKVLLPLERAVEVLSLIAASAESKRGDEDIKDEPICEFECKLTKLQWDDHMKLLELEPENVDLQAYCHDVVEQTKISQSRAAFTIISSALAQVLDVLDAGQLASSLASSLPKNEGNVDHTASPSEDDNALDTSRGSLSLPSIRLQKEDMGFKLIIRGLIIGSSVGPIQDDCRMLLKGLATHFLFMAVSHGAYIHRIDANGCRIKYQAVETAGEQGETEEKHLADNSESQQKISPRLPFGYFELSDHLRGKVDLFSFNAAMEEFSQMPTSSSDEFFSLLILHLIETSEQLRKGAPNLSSGADAFFENLLSVLCRMCSSVTWNRASSAYLGLCSLIGGLGAEWSRRYEVEIMNAAILAVKKCPKEIPYAGVKSLQLFSEVCSKMYPSKWINLEEDSTLMIRDALHLPSEKKKDSHSTEEETRSAAEGKETYNSNCRPSDEVLYILVNELASTSHIVR